MEFTKEEIKTLVESLIFAATGDTCLSTDKFDANLAVELAGKLNDKSIELGCSLYCGTGYYEQELSEKIEKLIPQIKIEK